MNISMKTTLALAVFAALVAACGGDDGDSLAEVVRSDGEVLFWYLCGDNKGRRVGCACEDCAPHDQVAGVWMRVTAAHRESGA